MLIHLSFLRRCYRFGFTYSQSKLVIDASIKWQKGTIGNDQTIKLSTTTGFYDSVIPTVSGATVFVTNSSNTVFNIY